MNPMSVIREKARAKKRRVVLPEGTEPRVIQAAKKILADRLGSVTLLGDEKEIRRLAAEHALNLKNVEIINPVHSPNLNAYAADFMELRKTKVTAEEQARKLLSNPLYFGAMMVRQDKVDASVAGSVNTTGDVLRAAIHVLGLREGIKVVSSCFLMILPKYRDQLDRPFLYADGAVMPNPTSEELASIAAATTATWRSLLGTEPRIAFLSFSTKGSAKHPDVDRVTKALEIFKADYPDIRADGELQGDAAIVPEIAERKAPGSSIGGDANILIFPNLDAGNIAYKLTQRLAGAAAIGPIVQGLAKPACDLSRGCSPQDIVDVAAVAMLMRE